MYLLLSCKRKEYFSQTSVMKTLWILYFDFLILLQCANTLPDVSSVSLAHMDEHETCNKNRATANDCFGE